MKVIQYRIEEKKLFIKEIVDKEDEENTLNPAQSYLFVSTLFDGITPLTTKDDKIVLMKEYLSNLERNHSERYTKLLNNLMHSVLYSKDITDLCNPDDPTSFYSILLASYARDRSNEKKRIRKELYDNSEEYIATLVRIIIKEYVLDVFETTDIEKMKGKGPFAVMRINKKSITSQYKNTRLPNDEKLSKYMISVFKDEYKKNTEFESGVNLCPTCPWKFATDCPKVTGLANGITLEDRELRRYVREGKQIVKITEDEFGGEKVVTDKILITKCRLHDSFVNRRKIREKSEELLLEKKKNSK